MQVTFMQHQTSKIAPLNPTAKSNDQIKYINTESNYLTITIK